MCPTRRKPGCMHTAHCVERSEVGLGGEGPARGVGLLARQVADWMIPAPLALPRVFVDVPRLRPRDAVEGRDRRAPEPRQGAEDRALLLRDLRPLQLVDHGVALPDRALRQLLGRVLAAEWLQVPVRHLRGVDLRSGRRGRGSWLRRGGRRHRHLLGLVGLVVGIGVLRGEECVQRAVRQLGLRVRGLGPNGLDDVGTCLEDHVVDVVGALVRRQRAHDLDLLRRRAGGLRDCGGEAVGKVRRQGAVHLDLASAHAGLLGCLLLRGEDRLQVLHLLHDLAIRGLRGLHCRLHDRSRRRGFRDDGG
mmetsp:Transcript_41369/g.115225  ORF Transcript_41369/g.115225 Transcript_41369/m.115225 type:complete len:305 (+) Transcript_41369:58-972(+)